MLLIKNFSSKEIQVKKLEKAAKAAVKIAGLEKKSEMSLVLCGDKKMKNLNKIYRKKDKTTDVLSFSAREQLEGQKPFILPENEGFFLGEIFISAPEAKRQSIKYNESLDRVLAKLLIHGILHLAGYDHEKNKIDAEKMFKLEKRILNKL